MSSRPAARSVGVGMIVAMEERMRASFHEAATQAVRSSNAFNRYVVLAVDHSMEGGLCVFYHAVGPDANGDTVYKVVRAIHQAEAEAAGAIQDLVRARWGGAATQHFARYDDPIPFTHAGEAYVVMATPRLSGGDVWRALDEGRVIDPVSMLVQVIRVVDMLHRCGWVHRDLKFENLMFATAAQDVVVLIDFGFAAKVGAMVPLCVGTQMYWTRRQSKQCASDALVKADPYVDWVAFAKMVFEFRRELGTGGLPQRFLEAATALHHESEALMTLDEATQELLDFAAAHRLATALPFNALKLTRSGGMKASDARPRSSDAAHHPRGSRREGPTLHRSSASAQSLQT